MTEASDREPPLLRAAPPEQALPALCETGRAAAVENAGAPVTTRDKALGQIAYEAHRQRSGGYSVVNGEPLPRWRGLSEAVQDAWDAAARAVVIGEVECNPECP